jgi:hypothetical protein
LTNDERGGIRERERERLSDEREVERSMNIQERD